MKNLKYNHKGVTLTEILVVVAIIGILSATSLPNIPPIIAGHRLRTSNNDLISKLRAIRGLAISKNRTLLLTMDVTNQWFTVDQAAHKEYNLLDKYSATNKDLNTTMATTAIASMDTAVEPFVYFSEAQVRLHLVPRWNTNGTPIFEVPINYLLKDGSRMSNNGVGCITMNLTAGGTATSSLLFYPSGNVEPNVTITLYSLKRFHTKYVIDVYKGGQVRSRLEGVAPSAYPSGCP